MAFVVSISLRQCLLSLTVASLTGHKEKFTERTNLIVVVHVVVVHVSITPIQYPEVVVAAVLAVLGHCLALS